MREPASSPYPLVDFHCDVLWKLLEHEELSFDDHSDSRIDVTPGRLQASQAILQTFAIYTSPQKASQAAIWKSVDLFYDKVLSNPRMHLIRDAADIDHAMNNGLTGALLSLEGVDGLQGDFTMLRLLYRLGLRAVGLTWNHANWAADGVLEPRQGGLTAKGGQFVEECERLGIILDVSHLTERGFWELADRVKRPFIASHSNAKALCPHARNLTDDQIKALIAIDGRIGITYVPYFVREDGKATIIDVLRHIEHVAGLGGAKQLMLGSDFDGIEQYVQSLRHPADVRKLVNEMLKVFPEQVVTDITSANAIRFLKQQLPAK
ncbi:membrane dipeptidase [Paenibacillus cellulosilyticus]|uniref:Membrane dipeptidase n=1 Tax=Paenibacillus cellulosilyticus TaxID=375489 RepID=A0A2V2YXX9_9BACL|nr:membrane dipeptidase [Paenibacillus cellulosilyticus]PWW06474.1 membrane dipeptidase [Paenibacillus cellulosilyticus]QKS46184.1 membrane dipeptidase [Paenibacillus cellulosilyticus]